MYQGKQINDGKDLLQFLNLNLMTRENIKEANSKYKDDLFERLLDNLLPKRSNYIKMSTGEIMFNIDQANHLTYDIEEESELKRLRELELEKEKER